MAQPAAGTALPSTSLTSGIVWARNEADTTASTQTAGALTYALLDSCVMAWGSDDDGRYKQYVSGGVEKWSGLTLGAERTMLCVVKYAANGGNQALIDSDENPPRNWQFAINSSGVPYLLVFDPGPGVIGAVEGPSVSTSASVAVVARIRNDGGTYKARVDTNGVAGTEASLSGTPTSLSNSIFSTGNRLGGGQPASAIKVYGETIWNRALSDVEMDAVGSDGWATYAAESGPTATLSTTLDPAAFSGTASVSPAASLSISTADAIFSGSASVSSDGVLTLPVLKNNTGTVLASETGATVHVYATTGAHVVTKTGQTTNGSGVMSITDPMIVASTQYRVVIVLASGAEGMDKVTAA